MSKNFKLNNFKFRLITNDNIPLSLKLITQDKNDNNLLKKLCIDIF